MHPLSKAWYNYLLALCAGALITLSLAPFHYWPLGIASTALLAFLLTRADALHAAKIGWFFGLGLFGSGTSWVYVSIHIYGYASVPLSVVLTAIFSAGLAIFTSVTCYIYARWVKNHPGGQYLGFAAILVLGEWWRSWFLTGLPWLYLGNAHIDTVLAGWAPIGGIYSLSFVVALTGATISNGLYKRRITLSQSLMILSLWLSGAVLNKIDWVQAKSEEPVKIAMVQANISQAVKWNRDQLLPTLNLYQQTSTHLWASHDIVIWPEAAIPIYFQNAKAFIDIVSAEADQHQATLITGIPFLNTDDNGRTHSLHNSIMAVGNGSGTYHKQRLVPFGEYVPLENLLRGLIQFFDLPMSSFTPGASHQTGLQAGNIKLAPFICYEVVYPDLIQQWLPNADMLITISNDAWFGASIGPLQHLQIAQMRALESGRYLLRSTGSGVSAIINHRGQITVRGGQFQREVISGEAWAYQGITPFVSYGSGPILILSLLICVAINYIGYRSNSAKMRG